MLVELPMVTMEPPDSTNLLELRDGLLVGDPAQPAAVFLGSVLGRRSAATPPPPPPPPRPPVPASRRADGAVGEHQHVELALQVAGIERGRIDHLEGKLVLLEQPARPARRHACRRTGRTGRCGPASASAPRRREPWPRRAPGRRVPWRRARSTGRAAARRRHPDGCPCPGPGRRPSAPSSASRRRRWP